MSKVLQDLANLAKVMREDCLTKLDEDPELLEDMERYLTERIESFPKYFSSVIMMETSIQIAKQLYDRENYQDKVQRMDQGRRLAHVRAAMSINQLNRLAGKYGLAPIFVFPEKEDNILIPSAKIPGDPEMERQAKDDRELAADAVYGFCKEVFLDARSRDKYNELENYTRESRDNELLAIGTGTGYFNDKLSVDNLIDMARRELEDEVSSKGNTIGKEDIFSRD